jgi:hypothetical protein
MVEILLEGINIGHPSASYPKCNRIVFIMSLPIKFSPIFDMGEGFKESEGDIFNVEIYLNRVIPL